MLEKAQAHHQSANNNQQSMVGFQETYKIAVLVL
jgi:hypothetical protein